MSELAQGMTVTEAAWLAGLWDGEGAVGIARKRETYVPQVQLCMTHEPTVQRAVSLLQSIGCNAASYRVAEKKSHHRDSYRFAMVRTVWVLRMADTVLPYAVTKKQHWQIIQEFCVARIERQGVTANGWLRRGGPPGWAVPYSDREHELARRLRELNASMNTRSATRMGMDLHGKP